ncbi:hypothetical protein HK105_201327 [Polyrhizophydium stewartii]|uniref:Ankyrin repeat domain-containing protein n=1 Tax=Polyrhizophydium stewartii TaxID=2732419 RepID=A0ABR4NHN8_9FUNG|nr:hypothetical protein HK105_002175 [Polyrhizophydium stewartii]
MSGAPRPPLTPASRTSSYSLPPYRVAAAARQHAASVAAPYFASHEPPKGRFAGCRDVADMVERLPAELEAMIKEALGAPTLHAYLHGRMALPVSPATLSLIWVEAFATNAVGVLPRLPVRPLSFERLFVRTQAMGDLICDMESPDTLWPENTALILMRNAQQKPPQMFRNLEMLVLECPAAVGQLRAFAGEEALPHKEASKWWRFFVAVVAAATGDEAMLQETLLKRLPDTSVVTMLQHYEVFKACFVASSAMGHRAIAMRLLETVREPLSLAGVVAANDFELFGVIVERFGASALDTLDVTRAIALHRNELAERMMALCVPEFTAAQVESLAEECVVHANADALVALLRIGASREAVLPHLPRAASDGLYETLLRVHAEMPGTEWPTAVLDGAAAGDSIDVVRWLVSGLPRMMSRPALTSAARHGSIATLEILHDGGSWPPEPSAADEAARRGHTHVLEWLKAHGAVECTTRAMDGAAAGGHLGTVQWLASNTAAGCTTGAMDKAAANGHLRVVQWLAENTQAGCTDEAVARAAAEGHAEVVDYLLSIGRPCSAALVTAAAKAGKLGVIKAMFKHCRDADWVGAQRAALARMHDDVGRWIGRAIKAPRAFGGRT